MEQDIRRWFELFDLLNFCEMGLVVPVENRAKFSPTFLFCISLQGKKAKNFQANVFPSDDTLIIRNAMEANSGAYQCISKNQMGESSSNEMSLQIRSKEDSLNFYLEFVRGSELLLFSGLWLLKIQIYASSGTHRKRAFCTIYKGFFA